MADELDDELRVLRRRAYGPDADIQGDPVAVGRLRVLERDARPVLTSLPASGAGAFATEDPPRPSVAATPPVERPGEQSAETPTEASVEPPTFSRSNWRQRHPHLVLVCVIVVTAIVSVAVTLAVMAGQRAPIAELEVDEDAPAPAGAVGNDPSMVRQFDRFYGLSVIEQPLGWGDNAAYPCLFIMFAAESTVGCGGGDFAATTTIVVSPTTSTALRQRFEVGTALQFVLDGDHVRVYVSE